jgi:DNA-binding PadR family transcriptional regulator
LLYFYISIIDISPSGIKREAPINNSSQPSAYLPLTEASFLILLSLAPGKKHGYAILKDVETMSAGKISLSTSTLYTALGRLSDQGLIERVDNLDGDELADRPGLPRKAYNLSSIGRRVLEAETQRLGQLLATARLRLQPQE